MNRWMDGWMNGSFLSLPSQLLFVGVLRDVILQRNHFLLRQGGRNKAGGTPTPVILWNPVTARGRCFLPQKF